jgi:hypothetical protein
MYINGRRTVSTERPKQINEIAKMLDEQLAISQTAIITADKLEFKLTGFMGVYTVTPINNKNAKTLVTRCLQSASEHIINAVETYNAKHWHYWAMLDETC